MFENEPVKNNIEQEKKELISKIDNYLNNFTDYIPEEQVEFDDPNYYKYKLRVAWFQGVLWIIEDAAKKQLISKGLENEVSTFYQDFKDRHSVDDIKTTKEEIQGAESLLKKAKNELCESK